MPYVNFDITLRVRERIFKSSFSQLSRMDRAILKLSVFLIQARSLTAGIHGELILNRPLIFAKHGTLNVKFNSSYSV